MNWFSVMRPFLFLVDPERAHRLTIAAMKIAPRTSVAVSDAVLEQSLFGLSFPNPTGLAAGFDKDAEVHHAMAGLGFGFVEIGTVTPLPQSGNAKPRLFRLKEDGAVINRMGFNNAGQSAAVDRLIARRTQGIVVGANIGANKDAIDRIADYVTGVQIMSPVADYLTVNISSPNTPGLRALQDAAALTDLLDAVGAARAPGGPPLFLKIAPDLEAIDIDTIARLALGRVDALIVANTTISRPPLKSEHRGEAGGLSGAPLRALAQQRLMDFRKATGGAVPLIGVGGIECAADAYARIRAGASLIQLYSALVFHGPGLVSRINTGLKALLLRDGFTNIGQAIGVDVR
jgi:dihydroorotate dehydrogenase